MPSLLRDPFAEVRFKVLGGCGDELVRLGGVLCQIERQRNRAALRRQLLHRLVRRVFAGQRDGETGHRCRTAVDRPFRCVESERDDLRRLLFFHVLILGAASPCLRKLALQTCLLLLRGLRTGRRRVGRGGRRRSVIVGTSGCSGGRLPRKRATHRLLAHRLDECRRSLLHSLLQLVRLRLLLQRFKGRLCSLRKLLLRIRLRRIRLRRRQGNGGRGTLLLRALFGNLPAQLADALPCLGKAGTQRLDLAQTALGVSPGGQDQLAHCGQLSAVVARLLHAQLLLQFYDPGHCAAELFCLQ
eukprot:Rhum_TRINITY_DN21641_c0_g1::Rhum_TRINITY_DN21641_c0_g1_i1::g.174424::m.174424